MGDDFFDKGYELPNPSDKYAKLDSGQNRFRIVSRPIMGYVWWEDTDEGRKPVRIPFNEVPTDPSYKHFWAMKVWSYDKGRVQVLEISQRTIQEAIKDLQMNPKWGDPREYDLVIVRKGEGLETTYGVQPEPKEELSSEVRKADQENEVVLEALFEGGDPFDTDVSVPEEIKQPKPEEPEESEDEDDGLPF